MDGDVQIALGTGDVRPLGLLGGTGEVQLLALGKWV